MTLTLKILDRFNPKNFMLMEPSHYERWLAESEPKGSSWAREKEARRRGRQAARPPQAARQAVHQERRSAERASNRSPPAASTRREIKSEPIPATEPVPATIAEALSRGYPPHVIHEWMRQGFL